MTAPHQCRLAFCRKGRQHHMVDGSHTSGCHQRTHGGPAGGTVGRRRLTAYGKKGSDAGLTLLGLHRGKGKERKSIYIAVFWPRWYTESAQAWITQFYLQITPCLLFLRECSPDVTTTAAEAADIQLQLTIHLSTPKG